jgi:putative addiction module component (TIGR02574 family)
VIPTLKDLGMDRLSLEERVALAQQLWDSVLADLERQPLTEMQRAELERRIAAADAHPERGIPWEQIRAEAKARSGR